MTRKAKKPVERLPPVADEVLDQFGPAAGMSMADIDAATRRLKQALVERMLGGELSHHLGYPPGGEKPDAAPNHRNGTSPKTVVTEDGPVTLAVPRDLHHQHSRERPRAHSQGDQDPGALSDR